MAFWLLKTEPSNYAWSDLERDGQTVWDGIGNNLALKYVRQMRPGDRALFYHTGKERQAVGIVEVVSEPYPDPHLDDPKRAVVDVRLARSLPRPVGLAQIKTHHGETGNFENFDLLKISRLSAVPVSEVHWQILLEMGGIEPE
ncbi:MAG: EVE domain-containing protein [Cyanophyceae cyanobacterium]